MSTADSKFFVIIGLACCVVAVLLLVLNGLAVGTIAMAAFGVLLLVAGLITRGRSRGLRP